MEINGLMFAAHMKSEATHEREIQRIIIGVGYDQMRMPCDLDLDFKLWLWAENREFCNVYEGKTRVRHHQ